MLRVLCVVMFLGLIAAALTATAQEEAATRDFNGTAALQNSGFYERAAVRWREFATKYPQDPRLDRVQYYLGIAQLKTDKFAEAQQTFEQLLAKYPTFKERDRVQFNLGFARYFLAEKSHKPEDYQAAAKSLAVVLEQHPQSTVRDRALFYQAGSQYRAGDAKEAVAGYQKFVAEFGQSPLLPDALYALGTLWAQQGDAAKASETFQRYLASPAFQQHERASEVRLRLGMALFDQAKFAEARDQFKVLVELPNNADAERATLEMARSLIELQQLAEAQAKLAEALTKYPQSPHKPALHYYHGLALYRQEKLEEARQQLEPAVATEHPLSAAAAQLLAKVLNQQKKAPEALQRLELALAKAGKDASAAALELERLSVLREIPARRKELPALYKALLEKYAQHPLKPFAQAGYATEALNQGDYATARTQAEAFLNDAKLADHPARPTALFVAGEAHFLALDIAGAGAESAKAEQYFRQLIEKYPTFADAGSAHVRIAQGLLRLQRWDDARNYATAALPKLAAPSLKADAYLVIGRAHAGQQRPAEAQVAYQAALALDPNWPQADEAFLWLADSLRQQNKFAEADQQLAQLLSKFATSAYRAQALVQRGELALTLAKYDDALTSYREVLQKHATDRLQPTAQYGLAAAHYAKGEDGPALAALNPLLATESKDPALTARARLLRAMTHERQQQFDPAAKDYEAFLATKPTGDDEPRARLQLARCQIALKQQAAAATGLAALVKDRPTFAALDQVLYELGHAHLALQQQTPAAEAFAMLTEKYAASPLAPEAWFHLGRYHEETAASGTDAAQQAAAWARSAGAFQQGADKAAVPELKAKLRFKQAEVLYRAGKYDAATPVLEQFTREHASSPLVAAARFLTGDCYFRASKFDQALPLVVQTATDKVEPYQALALFRAGQIEAHRKQWAESYKHFLALLNGFPTFAERSEARYGLGVALYEQNKLAEARAAFVAVTGESEAEPAAKSRFMLGEIAFAEKKFADAIEQFLLVSEGFAYPHWQGLARFETARAFIELGDKPQAIKALENLLARQPEHAKVADARNLLAELKK